MENHLKRLPKTQLVFLEISLVLRIDRRKSCLIYQKQDKDII